MRRRISDSFIRAAALATVLLLAPQVSLAVEPTVWRQDSQAEFSGGEARQVSLTRAGSVTLAPKLEPAGSTGEAFVWALARDTSGRIYAATGSDGKLFRLPGDGSAEVVFDSPEVALFSLAAGPKGTIFAGSSPEGKIYRITSGGAETFCSTGDSHVWALVPGPGGVLYAATGGTAGRVLKIDASGQLTVLLTAPDPNVVSLIRSDDGSLYAGTDESGLVYRLKADGRPEVLYDAPMEEIHALAAGPGGMVYAGAMSQRRNGGGSGGNGTKKGSSAVYAIRPSGAAFELWRTSNPLLVGLNVEPDGSLLAVTGEEGAITRIYPDGTSTELARMEDAQPWAVLPPARGKGDYRIGTSGDGRVFRLDAGYASEGTLTSDVRDFGVVSTWGHASWTAETPARTSVSLQTRSGNSEVPDETWSDWSRKLTAPGRVQSPPARFLQYRATLSGSASVSPALERVTLAGQQENVQPLVSGLSVSASSGEGAAPAQNGGGSGPEPAPPSSKLSVNWTAQDVNMDHLRSTLYYRGEGERQWKLLAEDITSTSYQWDTASAPEGAVQVRVVVTDEPSNPAGTALTSEAVSEPFDIDHTPPVVTVTRATSDASGRLDVAGRVTDGPGTLRSAQYSLNAGPWRVVFPEDGIFDTSRENLAFTVSGLSSGEYTIVIRATDASGNIGVARRVVEVK